MIESKLRCGIIYTLIIKMSFECVFSKGKRLDIGNFHYFTIRLSNSNYQKKSFSFSPRYFHAHFMITQKFYFHLWICVILFAVFSVCNDTHLLSARAPKKNLIRIALTRFNFPYRQRSPEL